MFTRLSDKQITQKIKFIEDYKQAENAAQGSKLDSNANVSQKNIATLDAEINKDINIQINRQIVKNKIIELYDENLANEYIRQIEEHEIYIHDETSLKPYCVSVSMYPFLLDGMKSIGGESGAPQHIESFCGSFINLLFAVSSQFAGAVATVEFLMYFDYFARKDYGDDYINTHTKEIENHLQHIIYSANQPAAARGYQSIFWNISIYDKPYFDSMFGTFCFPDFSVPKWETVSKLQEFFLTWFNNERTKAVLTFPVVTAAMLVDNEKPVDTDYAMMCAEQLSNGNSFFIYMSESPDSLASCCRLRNEISDNTFSYTLGAGGVSTGSVKVITMNINRLIQKNMSIDEQVDKIHKYHVAYRKIVEDYFAANLLPVYSAGYISLKKQFSTIGINGLPEAAEFKGIKVTPSPEYKEFVDSILKIIYDKNRKAKNDFGYMFNTEFVPAENLGVKNAQWDKKDSLVVPRDCYNSYFYIVEDEGTDVYDKFVLHGKEYTKYLDGGSALHLNLDEKLSKENYYQLFKFAAKTGCNYWCVNVKITLCNECENIDKKTLYECPKCRSRNVDHATRIIGYLKRISAFSKNRQSEEKIRFYH